MVTKRLLNELGKRGLALKDLLHGDIDMLTKEYEDDEEGETSGTTAVPGGHTGDDEQ